MAWVRIHDGALSHPKIAGLFDWRDPLHVWLWGLSQSQMHLTDGLIVRDSVPKAGLRTAEILVQRGLWETHVLGWKVHDYLFWNDSREVVQARQQKSRDRLNAWKEKHSTKRVSNAVATPPEQQETTLTSTKPNQTKPNNDSEKQSRSKRPIFTGQRLTVFEWQLENLGQILGPYTDSFDLHAWFFDLDMQMAKTNAVIPKRDGGIWLESQVLAECRRRGLPVAQPEQFGKQTTRLAAALANIKGAGV